MPYELWLTCWGFGILAAMIGAALITPLDLWLRPKLERRLSRRKRK